MVCFIRGPNGKLLLRFKGDNFDELKGAAKSCGLSYLPEERAWTGANRDIYQTLQRLQEVEELQVPDSLMEQLKPRLETKFVRIPFNKDLMLSDPIGSFQLEDIRRCLSQNRIFLAHEMGLGKTFIAITALNHLFAKGLVDRLLIVVPPEAIYNWRRELLRFGTMGLKMEDFYIVSPSNRTPTLEDPKVIITTYRGFLMISDDYYKKKHKKVSKKYRSPTIPFELWGKKRAVILDEAHAIKNRQARQTQTIFAHKDFFDYRFLLTGTPDPNGIEGYWSEMTFLDEGIIGQNYTSWIQSVASVGNRWSEYAVNYFYPEKVEKFIDSISPWVIRRFTKDNLDLPDLVVEKIYTELSSKQRDLYQQLISDTLVTIKEEEGRITPRTVTQKFPYLSLALDNPSILKGKIDQERSPKLHRMVEQWKFEDHSKLEVVDSLLERYIEEQDKKAILWSGHPVTMDEMEAYYRKKGYEPIVLHGESFIPPGMTKAQYRDQQLEIFKSPGSKCRLLIASYLVLSTAVNITESSRNVYWDRSYNLTYWLQSIKRTHRYGQRETVLVNPILFEDSLDLRLDLSLERKEDINNSLFNRSSLSADEWKSIFMGKFLDWEGVDQP